MSNLRTTTDHREKPPEDMDHIEFMKRSKLGHLVVGDFAVHGLDACVEHKSKDLNSSLQSGLVVNQLINMLKNYKISVLATTGNWDLTGKMERPLIGRLASIIARADVEKVLAIIPLNNYNQLIYFVQKLFEKVEDEQKTHKGLIYTNIANTNSRLDALSCPKTIGPKLAGLLLDKFETIQNIANAEIEDYMKIKGIGRKKAEKIKEFFCKKETKE